MFTSILELPPDRQVTALRRFIHRMERKISEISVLRLKKQKHQQHAMLRGRARHCGSCCTPGYFSLFNRVFGLCPQAAAWDALVGASRECRRGRRTSWIRHIRRDRLTHRQNEETCTRFTLRQRNGKCGKCATRGVLQYLSFRKERAVGKLCRWIW
jgi:hypothetical protein